MTAAPDPGRPEYEVLWRQARKAVQRGQVKLGYKAPSPAAAAAVSALVGRPLEAGVGTTVPVADLGERVASVFGRSLAEVLTAVHGQPLAATTASQDASRREWTDAILQAALDSAGLAQAWWASTWIDQVRRYAKIAPERLAAPARRAAAALARMNLTPSAPATWLTRADLAAEVGGSLSTGTKAAALALRAAALAHGVDAPRGRAAETRLWERCGVADGLSTVLVSGFPGTPGPVGVPLRSLPDAPDSGVVRVCARPALMEAATGVPLVCLSGRLNPAARTLLSRLVAAGRTVTVHTDFDATGLTILREAITLGALPWRMSAADYREALDLARAHDTDLPALDGDPGPTPWDPDLAAALRAGWAIPEEVTTDLLLSDL
ncbi:DUF2399 domain-containing protein [Actinokineospora guangxiensis]|uniref:DUF2399 domain-containing protein n=1 Tax=Actinokineospora guangxiensis TaxID=1490288 RepID=A0ABW0EKL8_9PSEU